MTKSWTLAAVTTALLLTGCVSERVVLLPSGDGKALTFGKFVKGPRVFKVYVTLLAADDTPGEHYVVDYRDDSAESETE